MPRDKFIDKRELLITEMERGAHELEVEDAEVYRSEICELSTTLSLTSGFWRGEVCSISEMCLGPDGEARVKLSSKVGSEINTVFCVVKVYPIVCKC